MNLAGMFYLTVRRGVLVSSKPSEMTREHPERDGFPLIQDDYKQLSLVIVISTIPRFLTNFLRPRVSHQPDRMI